MQWCCNTAIYVNFPHHLDMFSSAVLDFSAQSGAGGTPWGSGVASAESCTHPAKRDRCFPPAIAERQRLPNVGIKEAPCVILSKFNHLTLKHRADSRFAPSQWETSFQSNAVSRWLGANVESALQTTGSFFQMQSYFLAFVSSYSNAIDI